MQRYYGQPYARLDDPATPAIGLDQYQSSADRRPLHDDSNYESHHHYHAEPQVVDLPPPQTSSYEPYRHEASFPDQHTSFARSGSFPKQEPLPLPRSKNNLTSFFQRHSAAQSPRGKLILWSSIAAVVLVVIIALAVGLGVGLSHDSYSYTPSFAHVTNSEAFTSGGATHNSVNDTSDGIGAGSDQYKYYTGTEDQFPASSAWISFEDMWNGNLATLQTSCENLDEGPNNSASIISDIYNAIQSRANASLVDHRFIFAVILQESKGCVHVKSTTSSSGVSNPGLMQSHNGASYSSSHSSESIMAMIQDGTQGTTAGDGLVQNLNLYGNPYKAARGYNSGYIPKSGNLSAAAGATACYVSDIANRLTGWVNAKSLCPGDES